ncbi:hypothetical protein B9Z55_015669 [Caenorhabditis nigoni]|uniref:Uncharacterized protein n=3 Tax=Caenorhabditis nigoni TaxID=1611254 RepID=A0A2G5UB77_9PELO|nr:hypothetical protein B9Z55_015669 [Caenorhabditis nigoni]
MPKFLQYQNLDIQISRKNFYSRKFFQISFLFIFVLFFICYSASREQQEVHGHYQTDILSNFMDYCALSTYDPWDPKIKPFLIEAKNPTKNCDRNWKPYTELKNGTWRILKEPEPGLECLGRCYYIDEFNGPLNQSDWFPPGPVDCEFLETVCWKNNETEVYGYIHTQIIPKNIPKIDQKEEKPNVLVYLVDSMSAGMAKRSLFKTLEFLKTRFESVEFPFLSQVGLNSKPNGLALWFGKQIESGKLKSGESIKVDWNETEFCEKYLDDKQHLFKDYKEGGYMTLHSEDWSYQTVTSYPDCKGFKNQYSDHTFWPFTKIYELKGTKITQEHLNGKLCREIHHAAMEQMEQFMDVYKDQPKFAWLWNVHIAHNFITGADRLDDKLLDFFERREKELDDYFIIVTSDHGFRMSDYHLYESENGAIEKHNPYLSISVPKKYRNPEILQVMQENSQRLQTQYDTRATLLDILKYQPSSHFTNRSLLEIPGEKGHSLLRHQPDTPRTCGRLPIPQQYCICRTETKDMKDDKALSQRFATELIKHVHEILDSFNLTSLCHRYEIDNVSHLDLYPATNLKTSTYRIAVKTKQPSFAHFETLVTENKETQKLDFEEVERLDTYGKTADCTNRIHSMRLCFCKEQNE